MHPDARRRVEPVLEELMASPVARRVVAVVVCGSAARGEESLAEGAPSDIDLRVVTDSPSPLLGRRISQILERHSDTGVEGGQVPRRTLSAHRTLVNYEAKLTGAVVAGDPAVLDLIPMRRPAEIPEWEGVRLLLNRVMEHVKVLASRQPAQLAVSKTYEALVEQRLLVEGRYVPTFAQRCEEVRRAAPGGPVQELREKYLATYRVRAGDQATLPDLTVAAEDLLAGIGDALRGYTGRDGGLLEELDRVSSGERNVAHRLYWLGVQTLQGRPWEASVFEDPSIAIWRNGVNLVSGRPHGIDVERLLGAWRLCPQILTPKFRS
jgi:predicted nucleotidyltransferase